jgi:hypothetical protein
MYNLATEKRKDKRQFCKKSELSLKKKLPVPVAAQSKAWVCVPSPAEIMGSNPTRGMDVCLL